MLDVVTKIWSHSLDIASEKSYRAIWISARDRKMAKTLLHVFGDFFNGLVRNGILIDGTVVELPRREFFVMKAQLLSELGRQMKDDTNPLPEDEMLLHGIRIKAAK